MSKTTSQEVAENSCVGAQCTQKWRKVKDGVNGLEVRSAESRLVDCNTGEPVAVGGEALDVRALPATLQVELQDWLGIPNEARLVDAGTCPRGCVCISVPGESPQNLEERVLELELELAYQEREWLSKFGQGVGATYHDARTGQLVTPAAHQRIDGPMEMNPGVSMAESYQLVTCYRAKLNLRVEFEYYDAAGECADNKPQLA